MSPSQATAALLAVGDMERDVEIIAALRGMASSPTRQTAYITGPSSGFARFLERKHPISYPIQEPMSPREPRNSVIQLTAPGSTIYQDSESTPYVSYTFRARSIAPSLLTRNTLVWIWSRRARRKRKHFYLFYTNTSQVAGGNCPKSESLLTNLQL